jgi:hypothetical protein
MHGRLTALLIFLLTVLPTLARAQTPAAASGSVKGSITAIGGTTALPGVQVTLTNTSGFQTASVLTESDGTYAINDVAPGQYIVTASLDGFVTMTRAVRVESGKPAEAVIDLPLSGFSERVNVEAASPVISAEGTLTPTETIKGRELEELAPSGGLQAAVRLLANIIQVPGGISIKGGRPSQASFQLGSAWIVDPATGLMQLTLPDDAIESISVLPNPYAVEYGRFSSGLTVIQTRRAGDVWKFRINATDPSFRYERGKTPLNIIGLGYYAPRVETGGPLVKNKLWLEQAVQYRYQATEIGSLPQDIYKVSQSFSSFTRVDGNLSNRHSFVASESWYPSVSKWANLGTFVPLESTVSVRSHVNQLSFSERAVWTDSVMSETTVQAHSTDADSRPQGSAPMVMLPQTTFGNYYNTQRRNTGTIQFVETVSASANVLGKHLFKAGVDLLHAEYDGWSTSRPVLIERENATLARRLDYTGTMTTQSVGTTDVALFGQDRYQPHSRFYVELGLRFDHDGVTDKFNLTPRIGSALLLNSTGTSVIRGGFGMFYERTPSMAGAFNRFEDYVDTRYAADGVTPLGPPVTFTHRTDGPLDTPRSRTVDISFDQAVNNNWSVHVGAIHREGTNELIVNPVQFGTTGAVELSSTGSSTYKGVDVGVHFTAGRKADVTATYTRSRTVGDQNSIANYFDTIMHPVFGTNAYATASTDVPNRLLAKWRYMPQARWLLLGIYDWRNGLPYSAVNEYLDYVGPRNGLRLPTYNWLMLGVEHHFTFLKWKPWIGVHVWDALGLPLFSDVQNNISSSNFRSLYNPEYRQYRVQLRFER